MIAAARIILGRWWPYLLAAAVVVGVGVTIVAQAQHIDALKADLALSEAKAEQAMATAELSEQLRGQEQDQARASFAETAARCDQRAAIARDAGQAIGEIVNGTAGVVRVDSASGSGAGADGTGRAVVGADQLRRVIGQAAASGADRVPVGSDGGASR